MNWIFFPVSVTYTESMDKSELNSSEKRRWRFRSETELSKNAFYNDDKPQLGKSHKPTNGAGEGGAAGGSSGAPQQDPRPNGNFKKDLNAKKNVNGAVGGGGGGKKFSKNKSNNNRRDKKSSSSRGTEESANFTPIGGGGNVKGHGQSKAQKIFGNVWVGEEDARRLQDLTKKLGAEGLSRKEILDALQRERRKAEKAARRQRDKTCFSCRQFGHVLEDCPKSKGGEGGVGGGGDESSSLLGKSEGEICFKCGSTEHTSRTCKRKVINNLMIINSRNYL
jgi:hypothetical protein